MVADTRVIPRLLAGKARCEAALPCLLCGDADGTIGRARLLVLLSEVTALRPVLQALFAALLPGIAALLPRVRRIGAMLTGNSIGPILLSGTSRIATLLARLTCGGGAVGLCSSHLRAVVCAHMRPYGALLVYRRA